MDIKKTIEDVVAKLKGDAGLKDEFMKDPVATLEKLTGIDLPDDQIKGVVDGVKAKLAVDNAGDAIKGAVDKVKDLGGEAGGAIKGVADKLGGLFKK